MNFPCKRLPSHMIHGGGIKVKGNNSYSQTYHSEHYGEKGHSIIFTVRYLPHIRTALNFFKGKEEISEGLKLETFVLIDIWAYFHLIRRQV